MSTCIPKFRRQKSEPAPTSIFSRCRQGVANDAVLATLFYVLAGLFTSQAFAQDDQPAKDDARPVEAASHPIGRYVDLQSPIADRSITAVKTAGIELAARAAAEDREAVLIVKVPAGTSQYHTVNGLVSELIKIHRTGVKTIAWVPEPVDHFNAMIVFACRDVIVHPDVTIGDFGRGEALDSDQVEFIRSKTEQIRIPRRPAALTVAMADPQQRLVLVDLEGAQAGGARERRLVLEPDLKLLQSSGVAILDVREVSGSGAALTLSTEEALQMNVLVSSTAQSVDEILASNNLPYGLLHKSETSEAPKKVRLIPLKGQIDVLLGSFLSRQIDRAVNDGADMIIFEVDSPGGLKFTSEELAEKIADLSDRNVRTIAWVPKMAISGAAIISLGCDQIILAPNARIGDAGAITMSQDGAFERVPEKVVSPFRVSMAALAERKGRPPAVLMAMVDKDLEVLEVKHRETGQTWFMTEDELHEAGEEWEKIRVVPESRRSDEEKGVNGLLLTADGERAHELKIAEPPVADFDELRDRLGLPLDMVIKEVERTWVDDFVVVLNAPFIVGLLFFLGILCIYLELHTMTGFFGIGAVLCFALYFWSKMLGGTAGSLEVIMFLLGFGLIACEIFVFPGFGVSGVTGILLVIASLVMASQTFQGLDATETIEASSKTLGQLGAAIVGVIITGSMLSKYLPKIPLFADMVLAPPGSNLPNGSDVRLRPELTDASSVPAGPEVGSNGTATTTLRPIGKARIDGELLTVVSEGSYIDSGTPIEVIEVNGGKIVVREVVT